MIQENTNRTAADLIYLVSCAVNKKKPDLDKCCMMDMEAVNNLANLHMLSAAAAYALKSAMPLTPLWLTAYGNATRNQILFNAARDDVLRELERNGIWYLPLKGIILKNEYPVSAMREMSDNDILCDAGRMKQVRDIMISLGYKNTEFGRDNHDVYKKKQLSFEMHRELFNRFLFPDLHEKYKDIKSKLIKDENNGSGYHMSDEDLYVYLVCHLYKHYIKAGTGLRSLLDIYVFNKNHSSSLNKDYIASELDSMGIKDFEERTRRLAQKTFSFSTLNETEQKELEYYIGSCCHGTDENLMAVKLNSDDSLTSKFRYVRKRLFPDEKTLEQFHPVVYRHRILYPFLLIFRPFKGLFITRKKLVREYKSLRNYKKQEK